MEFIIKDKIREIDENAEDKETLSVEESSAIRDSINSEMEKVKQEFRTKQNKSIESASKAWIS